VKRIHSPFHYGLYLTPRSARGHIDLSSDLLDRIDEIVPPGYTINIADNMWRTSTSALDAAFRRR